jgi:hypothetical protein
MDKVQRSYFWRGHKEAKGGHCLVAWDKLCRPTDLGGLGIFNLRLLGWALRARWLWLKKTEPHRTWASLDIQVPDQVQAFFKIAICSEVENGEDTLFWIDRWLHGQCIADLAPSLFAAIPQGRRKQQTLQSALLNQAWITDIQGNLSADIITDYIQLWDLLDEVQL